MQWEKKEKLNNEGFSLVEILTCITILSLITSAVLGFMMVGTKLFQKSKLEVDMQSEARVLKNYMNDLIVDAAVGVEFYEKSRIENEQPAKELFGADSCLIIYGENNISYLVWVKDSKQVHYLEKGKDFFVKDDEGNYQVSFTENEKNVSNWPVMAKYVSGFQCDLDNLKEGQQIFCASLNFELQETEYATNHVITLRNEIFGEGNVGNYYDEEMGAYEDAVTRITLAPGSADKAIDRINGTTVTYTHTVSAIGNIDTGVVYSVEGNRSSDTGMQDNVLFIAPDETASTLTVICRAKADYSVSTTAIVNLANVTTINLIPKQEPNYKKFYYYPKTVVDFNAVVEGDFITADGSGVTWSLESEVSSAKIEESTLTTCKVNVGTETNSRIVLKATSIVDPNVTVEYTIYTADIVIGELYIAAQDGMYMIKRGDSLQLQVLMNGRNLQSGMICSWRILNSPLPEEELSIDSTGKITASTEIPYNKEYQFTIEATVTNTINGEEKKTTTCAILMDKVSISFEPGYAIVVANEGSNPSRVKMFVDGLKVNAKEVTIQSRYFVKNLECWTVPDASGEEYVILNISLNADKVLKEHTYLRASLRGHSSVYTDLPVSFYKWNMIYNGRQVYVPVPGDGTNLLEEENGIPVTQKEVIVEGITYGYKNVTVNGVVYHYYVDKRNREWYLRVENDSVKYSYDKAREEYVSLFP